MKLATTLVLAAILATLAACGSTAAPTVYVPDVAPAVAGTATAIAHGADVNQRLANQYINHASNPIAGICRGVPSLGHERVARIMYKEMGPQMLRRGGQPTEVINLILDRC